MEELLPPLTQDGNAFEPTRVRQFTVFLENRVGRLQNVVLALEESAGPIVGLSSVESAECALVRVICAHPEAARHALGEGRFSFSESEILAVELPRKNPKPLFSICSALLAAEINIHYVYSFSLRNRGPILALYVDDPTLAAQLLLRKRFTLIGESDLK